jgi:type III restriction enzyme
MSVEYKNQDFILDLTPEKEVIDLVNKYEAYFEALSPEKYYFQREAIKEALKYLLSDKYTDTKELALENYQKKSKLQQKYKYPKDYLAHFPLKNKKSLSIDLATATGKSWVIYGIAQIMLAEGIVDKVLVLCPSNTIESELKQKFELLSGDSTLKKILQELEAVHINPAIKSANDPIIEGDICVENIHAVYERTGSSIDDSFKGQGERTLVLNDEAHHIYSGINYDTKKWMDFLRDKNFNFEYIVGLTGTPYIENEYFHNVIYRYGLRQAMDEGVVKKLDYKIEEDHFQDKGFYETYHNHIDNIRRYGDKIKPISIVVTERVVTCVQVWDELIEFIMEQESITRGEAEEKIIWVASGIPGGKDGDAIKEIISNPEKVRKENMKKLKYVDEEDNNVEWIVSVSMLTEGWDVKNVFQIVPHEKRAFNSKLLIAQVLGRGLRTPKGIEDPYVKINNHESWTNEIDNLCKDVLEIENKLTWGYYEPKKEFSFPLFNLDYETQEYTVEKKEIKASEPSSVTLADQAIKERGVSEYSHSGKNEYIIENKNIVTIENAVNQIKLFFNKKDTNLSNKWSKKRIYEFIIKNLEERNYQYINEGVEYISKDNLQRIKQAFGPMFRETGKEYPRRKKLPEKLKIIELKDMQKQYFNESSIKNRNGYVFYSEHTKKSFEGEQEALFNSFLKKKTIAEDLIKDNSDYKFLEENLIKIDDENFKSPLNLIYVTHSCYLSN